MTYHDWSTHEGSGPHRMPLDPDNPITLPMRKAKPRVKHRLVERQRDYDRSPPTGDGSQRSYEAVGKAKRPGSTNPRKR